MKGYSYSGRENLSYREISAFLIEGRDRKERETEEWEKVKMSVEEGLTFRNTMCGAKYYSSYVS